MEVLKKTLWEIIEVARNGDLDEVANGFLKDGLKTFYIKYVYDKDMDALRFFEAFDDDVKNNRVEPLKLYDVLYKIYHLHRDIDKAIKFKKAKIKYMKEHNLNGIVFERYELANLYFDKERFQKAIETINKVIKNIDTKNMTVDVLELFTRSLIMQNQLKQNLKYKKDEVLEDIKYVENIFLNTKKHYDSKKQSALQIQILYLYLSFWLVYQEYAKAIVYGSKAVEILESGDVPIKISLKYRIYENLAYAYLLNKNYDKAIMMAKRALKLKNSLVSLDTFSVLVILSEANLAIKEYEEALNYAHEANTHVNNSLSKLEYMYELLAKVYKAKDNEDEAKEYLEKLCRLQEASK